MKALDRYIVRSYLTTAILFLLTIMSLRIVMDMFFNMDEFAEKADSFTETASRVFEYYSCQSFAYFAELGGVVVFLSAAFTLARMNHTNELTAMLASGVSLYRVVWPIVLCAMLMGGAIIVNQELIVPHIKHKLARDRDNIPGTESFRIDLMADGNRSVWYATSFRPDEEVMRDLTIAVRDEKPREMARIVGASARPAVRDNQNGWLISEATLFPVGREGNLPTTQRIFTGAGPGAFLRETFKDRPPGTVDYTRLRGLVNPMVEDTRQGLTIRAERLVLTPPVPPDTRPGGRLERPEFTFRSDKKQTLGVFVASSAQWSGGQGEDSGWELTEGMLFYPSDLTASDITIRQSGRWVSYLSSGELSDLLRLKHVPDQEAALLTRHLRVTECANVLIILLLGLPFILSRERDLKTSAGLCLLVVGFFYASVYGFRYVGLSPALAAWLPVLVFGLVAAVTFDSIKT